MSLLNDRLPVVDNPRSARVKKIVALGRRSFRAREALLRVEGPQAVSELLAWRPETVRDVYLEAPGSPLWEAALACTKWVHETTPAAFAAISDAAQGAVAICTADALGPIDYEDGGTMVVLPRTQDPGNVGTIIRAADAFGAVGVIAGPGTADVTSPKVIRASAGSIFHLGIANQANFVETIDLLKRSGRTVLGTSAVGEQLSSANPETDVAWVFGNEAQGLSEEESALCDRLVAIPMSGNAESLNVGLAAGVCLYQAQEWRGQH